jgi:hypothetical protein
MTALSIAILAILAYALVGGSIHTYLTDQGDDPCPWRCLAWLPLLLIVFCLWVVGAEPED